MGFWQGFSAPWRAARLLARHPSWWPWALAPGLIGLCLFVASFWYGYESFRLWLEGWLPGGGQAWYWAALGGLLRLLAMLVLLVLQVVLVSVVGRTLAAPFLEALTVRAERGLGGGPPPPPRGWWTELKRILGQEIRRTLIYLAALAALALVNLLPGLGQAVYGLGVWLVTAFFLALEFLDYPLDRRGLPLGRKLAWTWSLGLGWLGFGLGALVLGMIPLLNLAFLPLAALGGTLLFLERA